MSDCRRCPSASGCRCRFNGGGLVTASGAGTGLSPRVLSLTCEVVQDALAPMFELVGFDYDDATGKLITPVGTPAGYILTADGAGGATWVAP